MTNDSTYFLALTLCIVGAFSFVTGRFYERADRWLRDWDAQRRATKVAAATHDTRFSLSRQEPELPRRREKSAVRRRFLVT